VEKNKKARDKDKEVVRIVEEMKQELRDYKRKNGRWKEI